MDLFLYLSVVFVTTIVLKFYNVNWRNTRKLLFVLIANLYALIIYANGQNVGIDRPTYEWYYKYCTSFDNAYMEKGFSIFVIICNKLGFDFRTFCFLVMLIVVFCIFVSIKNLNLERQISFAYFIFYFNLYFVGFNLMRQIMAVAIVILAYSFSYNKRNKLAVLLILIACSIHITALIGIPIIIFAKVIKKTSLFKFLRNNNIMYILYMIVISAIIYELSDLILSLSHRLGLFSSYDSQLSLEGFYFLGYFLPLFFVVLFFGRIFDDTDNVMMMIWTLQVPLQILGVIVPYADRLSIYASAISILLISKILNNMESRINKRSFKILIYCYYICHFVILYYILGANGLFPYESYHNY